VPTDPDDGRLIARAGEHICCSNGHPNFRLLAEARAGALIRSSELEAVNGMSVPVPKTDIQPCVVCGAAQYRIGPTGRVQFNIDGEWRGDGVFLDERTH